MLGKSLRVWFIRLSVVSLVVGLLVAAGGSAAAGSGARAPSQNAAAVTSSSLGTFSPTFAGPAATGCRVDCHLLTGPFNTPSTAAAASGHRLGTGRASRPQVMPPPDLRHVHLSAAQRRRLANATRSFPVPSVSCQPLGTGCDGISTSTGGATGVKGLNAVDSAEHSPLVPPPGLPKDVEPPDQGLCAGNGSVVETNNIGEILVFNTALKRKSAPISATRSWASPSGAGAAAETPHACMTPPTAATGSSPRSSRPALRRAAVLSPDASRAWLTMLRGHRGHRRQQPVRPLPRVLLERQLQPGRARLSLLAQRLREDLGDPGRVFDVLRRVPAPGPRPGSAAVSSTGRRNSRSARARWSRACQSRRTGSRTPRSRSQGRTWDTFPPRTGPAPATRSSTRAASPAGWR